MQTAIDRLIHSLIFPVTTHSYVHRLTDIHQPTDRPMPRDSPGGVAGQEAQGHGGGVVPEAADELELHVHHAQAQELVLFL